MNLRIIDSLDGLDGLRMGWSGLEKNATLPMQEFAWSQACAAAFRQGHALHILALDDSGRTRAVAPLVRRRGKPCLEMLGVAELNEPTDVIADSPEALQALAKAVVHLGIPLLLQRIPADSPFIGALGSAFRGRGILFTRTDNSWPWIALDSGWEEPESRLRSGPRGDLRRAQRYAGEFGMVSFETITPTGEALPGLLDLAFAVEAASWKAKAGTALAVDTLRGPFFRRYAETACANGTLRMNFMRINQRPVAMQIGVESRGHLWLLKIGYDGEFAHCAPGNVLMRQTLRQAAQRGLKSVSFLGVMESWKRRWTDLERPSVILRGYPFGIRGALRLTNDLVKSGWTKWKKSRSRTL